MHHIYYFKSNILYVKPFFRHTEPTASVDSEDIFAYFYKTRIVIAYCPFKNNSAVLDYIPPLVSGCFGFILHFSFGALITKLSFSIFILIEQGCSDMLILQIKNVCKKEL